MKMKLRITTKNVHTIPLYVFQKIDFTGFSLRRDHPEAWNLIMLWSYVKRDKKSLLATVHQLLKINLRTEERSCDQPTVIKGVPSVGGLKFSMAQNKIAKSASWGKCRLGDVPVRGSASSPNWPSPQVKITGTPLSLGRLRNWKKIVRPTWVKFFESISQLEIFANLFLGHWAFESPNHRRLSRFPN